MPYARYVIGDVPGINQRISRYSGDYEIQSNVSLIELVEVYAIAMEPRRCLHFHLQSLPEHCVIVVLPLAMKTTLILMSVHLSRSWLK